MPSRAVVWFRRDLRVADHPALRAALDAADQVVPVFVVDRTLLGGRPSGPNRRAFLRGPWPVPGGERPFLGVHRPWPLRRPGCPQSRRSRSTRPHPGPRFPLPAIPCPAILVLLR